MKLQLTVVFLIGLFLGCLSPAGPAIANGGSQLERYTNLQKDLLSRRPSVSTVADAVALFPDQHGFINTVKDVYSLATNKADRMVLDIACQRAYAAFIKLPASENVLLQFLSEFDASFAKVDKSVDTGEQFAWGWAYAANAAVDGFAATSDGRFIDIVLRGAREAFANTDKALGLKDSFGREHLDGWSFHEGGKPAREETMPGRIVAPILKLALEIKDSNAVDDARKREAVELATRGISILKKYLAEQQIDGDNRFFENPWTGEQDAMNHIAAFAEAAMLAYQFSGDPTFRSFAQGFENYFISHTTPVKSETGRIALSWPYQVLPKGQTEEQFWKAAITLPAIVYLDQSGLKLKEKDRVALIWSVIGLVIRQDRSINQFVGITDARVTGKTSEESEFSRGLLFTHLMAVDVWEPIARDVILDTVAARPDVFPNGLLLHISDAVAYAHMLRYPQPSRADQ